MRPKVALHYKRLAKQRKSGGWTHGWFLYHLDQEIILTHAEKDAICKALGYKSGWTLETEYILYRQWQKDQIISQILEYHNTPSFDKIFPPAPSIFELSPYKHLSELAL
jgi:hypothetical protein